MNLTQADIINLLANNDRAICRALVVLNNNQTFDEQASESTTHHNGKGFRPSDARMGTSMANFFLKRNYLTPKQIAFWRKPNSKGVMKIAIYWRQLIEAARAKASQVEMS